MTSLVEDWLQKHLPWAYQTSLAVTGLFLSLLPANNSRTALLGISNKVQAIKNQFNTDTFPWSSTDSSGTVLELLLYLRHDQAVLNLHLIAKILKVHTTTHSN